MPGSASYAILFLGTLLEALVVVCAIRRKVFRKYFVLNLYMALCLLVSWGRHYILAREGWTSLNYRYFYFYTDALLTIVLYFSLISLYLSVFEEMKVGRYLRLGAVALLAGTAWFTYAVVSQSSHKILTYFAFELSQNLYFVGLVLTYVLWAAVLKMRQTPALLVQLVLSLGIYFSFFAACYALSNLHPTLYSRVSVLFPVVGCLLPLSWVYAFWRVPNDARLSPARLAMAGVPR
jgi:hypothetical protein